MCILEDWSIYFVGYVMFVKPNAFLSKVVVYFDFRLCHSLSEFT